MLLIITLTNRKRAPFSVSCVCNLAPTFFSVPVFGTGQNSELFDFDELQESGNYEIKIARFDLSLMLFMFACLVGKSF